MEGKKKRKFFTPLEVKTLLRFVGRHKNIIDNKTTDAISNRAKVKAWSEVTKEFNSTPGVEKCTVSQLQNRYRNMKRASGSRDVFLQSDNETPPPTETITIKEERLSPSYNSDVPSLHDEPIKIMIVQSAPQLTDSITTSTSAEATPNASSSSLKSKDTLSNGFINHYQRWVKKRKTTSSKGSEGNQQESAQSEETEEEATELEFEASMNELKKRKMEVEIELLELQKEKLRLEIEQSKERHAAEMKSKF